MQVAAKHMAPKSTILGVDLVPIKPVPGAIGIVADITTDKCRQLLKKELRHFKANVVLNDGAPNVGRDWNQDAYTQNGLVLMSLKLACEWLVPGGTFVSKVFRSRDYNSLMYVLQKLFKNVRATKPQSSRNVSAEIFVVCQGYLAPNKIDPRMLDPKFVFEDILDDKNTQKVNIFAPEKKKRQREGYADGNVGLHTKTSVGTFIASESYLDILAANNALVFEAEDRLILQHPGSTEEIKDLLSDLKVLGKKEFRQLVKWRDAVKSWIGKHAKKAIDSDEESEGEEGEEDGSDGEDSGEGSDAAEDAEQAKLESMVDEVKERKLRDKKALRRKRDKARGKAQERQALSMDHPMDFEDVIQDTQLFAIKTVKNQAGIDGMVGGETWVPEEDDAGVALPAGVNFKDHDEYGEALEDELEADYAEYKERRGMTKRKVLLGKSGNKIIGEAVDQNEDAPDTDYIPEDGVMEENMNGSDSEDDDAANPLIATRSDGDAAKRKAALWFSQSQFGDLDESDDDDEEDIATMSAKAKAGADADAGSSADQSKELVENFDEIGDDPDLYDTDDTDADEEDNFEVVSKAARAQKVDNSGNLDAEGLAVAAEMIIRKRKRELIDASYNRYAFRDDPMPNWFDEEESNHIARGVPMTKEMAMDIQARQRELNARPIKKVLEAKARKKKKVNSQLDKLKSKATAIYENPDLSEREKNTQIQSLYNKTRIGTEDKKPQVVVARKGMGNKRPAGVKGKYIMVDGRSKTDLRAKKRLEKKRSAKRKYK